MAKEILFGEDARKALQSGVDQLADAVISYSKNIANGNTNINDISTKLKIQLFT